MGSHGSDWQLINHQLVRLKGQKPTRSAEAAPAGVCSAVSGGGVAGRSRPSTT
jgi:hypothetical protein